MLTVCRRLAVLQVTYGICSCAPLSLYKGCLKMDVEVELVLLFVIFSLWMSLVGPGIQIIPKLISVDLS